MCVCVCVCCIRLTRLFFLKVRSDGSGIRAVCKEINEYIYRLKCVVMFPKKGIQSIYIYTRRVIICFISGSL